MAVIITAVKLTRVTLKLMFADWVNDLGKCFFFCLIRCQHSQSHLEMVWRDSFSRFSNNFYRKLLTLRFLPGLLCFALTYCPWVSKDGYLVTVYITNIIIS